MPVISLNADTAMASKRNYVVPGPSSVAAAISTRAAARIQDVTPQATTVTITAPATNGEATLYSQTLTPLG